MAIIYIHQQQRRHEVIQKYEIGRIIGDGNFAVVHECFHKSKKMKYALKIIDKTKCKGKEAMIANEVSILRKVKHKNIIELIEDFDYTNQLYLVCELVT
ncbi:doublecortin-like kinase 1b, partial [Leptotrombidium deliense]